VTLIEASSRKARLTSTARARSLEGEKARRYAKAEIMNSRARATLEELAEGMGAELSINVWPKGGYRSDRLSVDEALGMMEGWHGLFSPTGIPYRSLDRTLMNQPGGVPPV
jgi:hypothetical protein